jgi:2-polyprenyl-6-methoxyphenol hydroxylase-like FAD-dependent oxidoreductase
VLCIGDAAHAMSPIGGVGINIAVQDAVATTNILCEPLRQGAVDDAVLSKIQARRTYLMKATQLFQVSFYKLMIDPFQRGKITRIPLMLQAFSRFGFLRGTRRTNARHRYSSRARKYSGCFCGRRKYGGYVDQDCDKKDQS